MRDEERENWAKHRKPAWLAQRLRVDVSCVHRWIRSGKIQVVQLPGGRYLIPDEECRRLMRPGYVVQARPAVPTLRQASASHLAAVERLRQAGIG